MAKEKHTGLSYERSEQIIREARAMRAEVLRTGFRALADRIAHPMARHQHA